MLLYLIVCISIKITRTLNLQNHQGIAALGYQGDHWDKREKIEPT